MADVCQTDRCQILQHLILEFVSVYHQKNRRLLCLVRFEQKFGSFNHRISLAAPLCVPDKSQRRFGSRARATTLSTAAVWCWRRINFCSSSSFSAKRMKSFKNRRTCCTSQKASTFASRLPTCSLFQLKMFRRTVFQVTPYENPIASVAVKIISGVITSGVWPW